MAFKVTALISFLTLVLAPLLSPTVFTVSAQGTGTSPSPPGTGISPSPPGTGISPINIKLVLHANAGCSGAAVFCANLPPNRCCSTSQPSKSFIASFNGGYTPQGYRGYTEQNCKGNLATKFGGGCFTGDRPYFSAQWVAAQGKIGASSEEIERETNITTSIIEAKDKAADCATPDGYSFIENGTEVTFPFPRGSKEAEAALYKLLADEATDGAALRKFANAHRLKEGAV